MSAEIARLLERYLGPDWLDHHDDPACVDRVLDIPDEELWAARAVAARVPLQLRARARAPALDAGARQRGARRRRGHDVRSQHADDRLRAPLHRLQAARADLPRSGSPGAHPQPRRAAPVQIVFAGKAHPADDVGKHHLQRIYRRALDPKFGGRIALRGRLRPARRPLPGAGLRRVAEQPAQAARGERHERHEGGDQRHAAHVDRRRLVGRRVHRRERLADRGPRRSRTTTARRTGPTRRRSTRCSSSSSCRPSTTATRTASRAAGCRS